MGRKGRRLKRKRDKHKNIHHLLFQRKHWSSRYAIEVRRHFTYEIPIDIHNELHRELHDIPLPPEKELAAMFPLPYCPDIIEACEWLIAHSDDGAFKACMRKQRDFLKERLE